MIYRTLIILGLGLLISCWVHNSEDEQAPEGNSTAKAAPIQPKIKLTQVAKGLKNPVHLTAPVGKAKDLYIIEQEGTIRRLEKGQIVDKPFLDIRDRVKSGGETGLLSLAFHPDYPKNGRIFVNYTAQQNGLKTRISEFKANPATHVAEAASERVVLTIAQPYENHNGGQIAFGPDGTLYIGMGDGGAGGDPHGHGQNLGSMLGDLLRIDINGKTPYGIPSDNPFVSKTGARPEIWAYGLRNPWRFSFDRKTGWLYVGDVGQDRFEEVDVVEKGKNYGWNIMEGKHCFNPQTHCNPTGLVLPVAEYGRSDGFTVVGGFVYRGASTALQGIYLYGDFGSGKIWGLKYDGKKVIWEQELLDTGMNISSFGEDAAGEVYVLDLQDGKVFQVQAAP